MRLRGTRLGSISFGASRLLPWVLDQLSVPAAAAFSLRKTRGSYTGPLIRVRRSSDNVEADIGFTSAGDLDTVALLAHCGAGSGFVVTWYDQMSSGRHATQSVAANQPRIVNAGVVEMLNGRPSVRMASASLSTTATVNTPAATISTVTSQPSLIGLLSQHRPFGVSGPLEGLRKWFTPATDGSLRYDGGFTAGSALPATPLVRSSIRTTTSASDWRNGDAGIASVETLPNIEGVMSFNPLLTADTDTISEAIIFTSALSTADRQTLGRNQGAYIGAPVA